MTLTSILPTLRASIPDPIATDRWPVGTRATVTDVLVAGVSLAHLAALCRTPCVHVADVAVPAPGRPGDPAGTVVVTSVTAVHDVGTGVPWLTLDADVPAGSASWSEVRLVGRASTARHALARLRGGGHETLTLPADVRAGDLLAVPCRGLLALRDVRVARTATDTAPEGSLV